MTTVYADYTTMPDSRLIPTTPETALMPASAEQQRMIAGGQIANEFAAAGAFEDYNARRADNTLLAHHASLARFADFLTDSGIYAPYPDHDDQRQLERRRRADRLQHDAESWRGITHGLVEGFRNWMVSQGDAIGSLNARLSAVKTYAKLAFKAKVIDPTEHALIRTVTGYSRKEGKRVDNQRETTRIGTKKAEHTSIKRYHATALKTHPDTPQGRRDRLLMCLLLDHGLRAGEVEGLTVGAFNLTEETMTFYRPKVDKVQTHELSRDALAAIKAWVDYGDVPTMNDQAVLRGSIKGGALTDPGMSTRSITKRVKALGANLEDKDGAPIPVDMLSAHDCRHYCATQDAKKVSKGKASLFDFQQKFGWASLAMAQRYVEENEISNQNLVDAD